jgi:hypothetical protein
MDHVKSRMNADDRGLVDESFLESASIEIARLATTLACSIHLEHVDRDGYALSCARDGVSWGGALRGPGYLKVSPWHSW